MRPKRKTIPLGVKLIVAKKYLKERGILPMLSGTIPTQLGVALSVANLDVPHFDHSPAIILRRINRRGTDTIPAMNDPEFIILRDRHSHHIKTNVRGDGAQFSDTALRNRERRRARPSKPRKPIQQRSQWPPKGSRKIQNRGFDRHEH